MTESSHVLICGLTKLLNRVDLVADRDSAALDEHVILRGDPIVNDANVTQLRRSSRAKQDHHLLVEKFLNKRANLSDRNLVHLISPILVTLQTQSSTCQ